MVRTNLYITIGAAVIALTNVPALAADIPTCDTFRSRLAEAENVLQVELPYIRMFREPLHQWKIQIDGFHFPGRLTCDEKGKFVYALVVLPWAIGLNPDIDVAKVSAVLSAVIYGYSGSHDADKIMAMAYRVASARADDVPGIDVPAVPIDADAKIAVVTPVRVMLRARPNCKTREELPYEDGTKTTFDVVTPFCGGDD
jgi:hypothetical protein